MFSGDCGNRFHGAGAVINEITAAGPAILLIYQADSTQPNSLPFSVNVDPETTCAHH